MHLNAFCRKAAQRDSDGCCRFLKASASCVPPHVRDRPGLLSGNEILCMWKEKSYSPLAGAYQHVAQKVNALRLGLEDFCEDLTRIKWNAKCLPETQFAKRRCLWQQLMFHKIFKDHLIEWSRAGDVCVFPTLFAWDWECLTSHETSPKTASQESPARLGLSAVNVGVPLCPCCDSALSQVDGDRTCIRSFKSPVCSVRLWPNTRQRSALGKVLRTHRLCKNEVQENFNTSNELSNCPGKRVTNALLTQLY